LRMSILVAGVGGQGGLTLSRIIALAASKRGLSARTGETLGMAQRGGSVLSYVKIGEGVRGPLFGIGECDVLLGLELMEAARAVGYLKRGGLAIVDPTRRLTVSMLCGKEKYPDADALIGILRAVTDRLIFVCAEEEAASIGAWGSANTLLLGRFVRETGVLDPDAVREAITEIIGAKGPKAVLAFEKGLSGSVST